ncbi:hypothetical protein SAMN05421812_104248 [Asanoa hainanensis]|uniref:Uncharacterized protein n=2 Tax=Asanoa hainanensis TaxID=560556 RepID=A0A239LDP5_9ACTN|nr:hypothetical protein SAMN05421812_104248 [Asanoa hainanensis]
MLRLSRYKTAASVARRRRHRRNIKSTSGEQYPRMAPPFCGRHWLTITWPRVTALRLSLFADGQRDD